MKQMLLVLLGIMSCLNSFAQNDSLALVAFYNSTGGPEWNNSSGWLEPGVPISQWIGVQTNENGIVTSINLPGHNLTGNIPEEIGQLVNLRTLDLSNNKLTGIPPTSLFSLPQLTGLWLTENNFDPWEFPIEFYNQTSLESVRLESCKIEGILSPDIGNLSSLRTLELRGNQFTGNIPDEIGVLSSIEELRLGANNFTGPIPEGIYSLTTMTDLDLAQTSLDGTFSESIVNLQNLKYLGLENSGMTGVLPMGLCDLPNFIRIDLGGNNFDQNSCPVVQCLLNNDVQILGSWQHSGFDLLKDCNINEPAPREQDSLALVALYNATDGPNWLDHSGWLEHGVPISDWYGVTVENERVIALNLDNNNLNGTCPTSIYGLTAIRSLEMAFNKLLSGQITADIANLTELNFLEFGFTQFGGAIPGELGSCPSLYELHLSNCNFTSIEAGLCNSPSLAIVNFDQNYIDDSSCTVVSCMIGAGINFEGDPAQTQKDGFSILLGCEIIPNVSPVLESDSLALVALYNATGGEHWNNNEYWLSEYPVTFWQGVRVEEGRVHDLYQLFENNMVGTLPPEFFNLTELEHVIFWGNSGLKGELSGIGNFANLHNVHIWGTGLGGEIPSSIGQCTLLKEFVIGGNNFEGIIPPDICNTDVYELSFEQNFFSSESCPTIECLIGNGAYFVGDPYQTQQTGIALAIECGRDMNTVSESDSLALVAVYNATAGPDWINNIGWLELGVPVSEWYGVGVVEGSVQTLYLGNNNLNGELPSEFYDLLNLRKVFMPNNQISGEILRELGNLINLERLILYNNQIGGNIPEEIGGLNNLFVIRLNNNQLTGTIPADIGLLESMAIFAVNDNNLTGSLPIELCQLSLSAVNFSMNNLDVDNCEAIQCLFDNGVRLIGDQLQTQQSGISLLLDCGINTNPCLPSDSLALVEFYQATNGSNWDNNENWLNGPVFTWHGVGVSEGRVHSLELFGNNLNGYLPDAFYNLTELRWIGFHGNPELGGEISPLIGNLIQLTDIHSNETSFTGVLPSEIGNCANLTTLHIEVNDFSGPLPSEFCNLPLTIMNIAGNNFEPNCEVSQCLIDKGVEFHGDVWQRQKDGSSLFEACGIIPNVESCYVQDSLALVAFYNNTGGENWNYNNYWLSEYPVTLWHGVGISEGRVHSLELFDNNLNGYLPDEFYNLTELRWVGLHGNRELRGEISPLIGNLIQLTDIHSNETGFTGVLPSEIGNCANLTTLHIEVNDFSGPLPSEFCNLPLTIMNIAGNNFEPNCEVSQCLIDKGVEFHGDIWQRQSDGASLFEACGIMPLTEPCAESDSLALVALYHSTEGENWFNNEYWLSEYPVALWPGVAVREGRVKELQLCNNNLYGNIPNEFYMLDGLEILDLCGNNLFGRISPLIGNLEQLHHLNFSDTKIIGELPIEIGNLSNLNDIHLAGTNLTGSIPQSLCNVQITMANFSESNFDEGSCPAIQCFTENNVVFEGDKWQRQQTGLSLLQVCGLVSGYCIEQDSLALVELYNATNGDNWSNNENWLTGPVSSWFGVYLENGRVVNIDLHQNNLTDTLPTNFFNLTALTEISLWGNNKLYGEISADIGNMLELQSLNIGGTKLGGELPATIGNCTNLGEIIIGGCNFSGIIPMEICNLPLHGVNFENNNFDVQSCELMKCLTEKEVEIYATWPWQDQKNGISLFRDCDLIKGLCNVSDSLALVALYNSTDGDNWTRNDNWLETPVYLWYGIFVQNGRVTHIRLNGTWQERSLNGILPPEIGDLTALRALSLTSNNLSGNLPTEIGRLSELERLYLTSNQFEGEIPVGLGNLPRLRELYLGTNQLTGNIPENLAYLNNLEHLNLSNNQLQGEIPFSLSRLYNLIWLRLDRNQLSGEIPPELGMLYSLRYLSAGLNQLSGEIPAELGSLGNLSTLNLRSNELIGEIPTTFNQLYSLTSLVLSENQMSGSVPAFLGQLENLSTISLNDNQFTGEIPTELTNLSNLRNLRLQENQLTGEVPNGFGNLENFWSLYLGNNNLSGVLPEDLCEPPFRWVDFSMNYFDNRSCPVIKCLADKGVRFMLDPSQTQISGVSLIADCVCEPTVVAKDTSVFLNEDGVVHFDVSYIDDGSFDVCGVDTIYISQTTFDCNSLGENVVDLTIVNIYGEVATSSATVFVKDTINPVLIISNDTIANEAGLCGAIVDIASLISASDICGIKSISNNAPDVFPVGTTEVIWTVTDNGGNIVSGNQFITVTNETPVISEIEAPADPVDIINEITLIGIYTDDNLVSATWDWGDTTSSEGIITEVIEGTHTYQLPGVYRITLIVEDACGEKDTLEHRYVVIYDPEGSFVTGGGLIESPLGASVQFPEAAGIASFGFVSKYVKNKVNPDGNTKFKFQAGDLDFKSQEYEWLVVSGSKAKFKGTGTINGGGNYGFMISAIDGDVKEKGDPDIFRIKIWDEETELVVYDNEMGAAIDSDPVTKIAHGSIVVHELTTKSATIEDENAKVPIPDNLDINIYPNPFTNVLKIGLKLTEDSATQIELLSANGQRVVRLESGLIKAGSQVLVYETGTMQPGIYFIAIKLNGKLIKTEKLIKAN